ncbi:MAG: hypothetical protein HQL47_01670 [Gammaproteobacteria bacterium]|nr:hypothetical protein [Gammaproteobacteria bacterium]
MLKILPSLLLASGLLLAGVTSPVLSTEAEADAEAQLDESLKRFGYLTGLARGCVVEQQQTDLEREALDIHAGIGRLLGTDRAFFFSSSFGYGTSVSLEAKECAEVLQRYEERVAKFRSQSGAKP